MRYAILSLFLALTLCGPASAGTTKISDLSPVDTVAVGDAVPIYSAAAGDTRRASMTTLLAFIAANSTPSTEKITQYASPSVNATNVALPSASNSIWLILTPTGTFAATTITLPPIANCVDRQELLCNCTQIVTTLTIAGNGATAVTGAPTTLAANAFFRLRFDLLSKTWYRVG